MSADAENNEKMTAAGKAIFAAIPCTVRQAAVQATLAETEQSAALIDSLERAPGTGDVVIVYTVPENALAYALQNGQAVSAALTAWTWRSEEMLKFLRRNRKRTHLVPDETFLDTPEAWLGGVRVAGAALGDLPRPDGLYLLLAQEALRRDNAARKLADELEASSVMAEGDPPELDLDAVRVEQTQAVRRLAALEDEFAAVKEEQEAVLRELVVVQEKAAGARDAHLTAERLEKQLHQLRQGLESTEAQLLEAQNDKGRMESDNRELSARIEELATNLNAARQAEGQFRAQAADLATELEAAKSTSRKRDQELGKLTALLTQRESELHDLSNRHEAESRAQAEALEASQAALHDTTRDLQAREQALAELQAVKKTRDRDLGKLTARLKRREDDLAKMYASRSYRITRPFRLLRAALRRGS